MIYAATVEFGKSALYMRPQRRVVSGRIFGLDALKDKRGEYLLPLGIGMIAEVLRKERRQDRADAGRG